MSPLTTHVLDTARGRPARGLTLTLYKHEEDAWIPIADGTTDADGRVQDLLPPGGLERARYRLVFHTGPWLESAGLPVFYPEVAVQFQVDAPEEHHHIPLLLSPYGFSTYRGS